MKKPEIEIEHRHSDYGADAGGYSILRINGVWIGRIEDQTGKDEVRKLIEYIRGGVHND